MAHLNEFWWQCQPGNACAIAEEGLATAVRLYADIDLQLRTMLAVISLFITLIETVTVHQKYLH